MLNFEEIEKIDCCLKEANLYNNNMNNKKRLKNLKRLKDKYRSKIKTDEYFLGLESATLEEQAFYSEKLKEDNHKLYQIRRYIGKIKQDRKKILVRKK